MSQVLIGIAGGILFIGLLSVSAQPASAVQNRGRMVVGTIVTSPCQVLFEERAPSSGEPRVETSCVEARTSQVHLFTRETDPTPEPRIEHPAVGRDRDREQRILQVTF